MNESKIILGIIQDVKPELWWMLFISCVAIIAALILKNFLESIVAYIIFRWDKNLGVGVKVNVRDIDGKITKYNIRFITVATEDRDILIPMSRWKYEKLSILYNDDKKRSTD